MAITTIKDLRAKIYPNVESPELEGTPLSHGVPAEACFLTLESLLSRGGVPYRVGDDWFCEVAIGYVDSTGAWTAIGDISGDAALLTFYSDRTGVVADTRDSSDASQLTLAAGGLVKIMYADSETSLAAGTWRYALVITWASDSTVTTILEGYLDALPAIPEASS